MARSAVIATDKLTREIVDTLRLYATARVDNLEKICEKVAKETAKELRRTAPKMTGSYAKSWTARPTLRRGQYIRGYAVYARAPRYRLTHLLEKEHDIVDPVGRHHGMSKPQEHIAKAEANAIDKLYDMIVADAAGEYHGY